jgi:predicted MFS family arabinose efflux permease
LSLGGAGVARRYALPALCLSAGLAGLSVGIIRPILVDIADTYAISVALAGQLMTGAALAGLVGNLALAPVIDLIDRRTAIVSVLSLMVVSSLVCAAAPSFAFLAIAYAAVGLSGITLLALIIAFAGDLYEGAERTRALGWIMVGNVAVGLVALPALSALAGRAGWPIAFYGYAALASAGAVLARALLP